MARFIFSGFTDECASPLEGQIACCKENGFSCIDLRGVNGKNCAELTNDEAKEIRARLDAEGLRVSCLGSPFGKISILDPFEPHLEQFRRALENTRLLGASRLRLFSFYIPKGDDPAKYRDEVLSRMNAFVEAAEGSGVTLLHENEKGIYGDTAERCYDLLVESDGGMKAIFDPANFIQCGERVLPAYERLENFVESIHIKDATPHGFVVPAGCGSANIYELIRRFAVKEGLRFLTLEPHLNLFDGLDKLERGGEETRFEYVYNTPGEAFAAAVTALERVLVALQFNKTEQGAEKVWTR